MTYKQQLPLFQPHSDWRPPSSFPDLSGAEVIAVDCETRDPFLEKHGPGWFNKDPEFGEVVGVSVATDFFKGYFPIAHGYGQNLDRRMVLKWLREQLSRPRQVKVFHNALYDLGWLRRCEVEVLGPIEDTMLAAPLIDENRKSYSLDNLGKDWVGDRKDERLLEEASLAWGLGKGRKAKGNMWKLPASFVGPYAEQDAALTLKLRRYCLEELEKQGLLEVYRLECRLLPMLLEMRWRGVKVDTAKAERMGEEFKAERDRVLAELKRVTGMNLDVWSNGSLEMAYKQMSVKYPVTEKGNSSFTAPWLEAQSDPLSNLVVKARKMDRAESTFSTGMILEHAFHGRLHCQFHQLKNDDYGTISYRFSSSNPNLQQVPARDPYLGPLIRSLFIPDEGGRWAKFDYSQQEPRLTVHYAELLKLAGAQEAGDYLRGDPNADFHTLVRDMVRRIIPTFDRKPAKTINLGKAYGMGLDSLCDRLGVTKEQGKIIVDAYDEGFPIIKSLTAECGNRAAERGFIKTITGHKCRFNQWEPRDWDLAKRVKAEDDPDKMLAVVQRAIEQARIERQTNPNVEVPRGGIRRAFTYRAMNRLIQGSAAGQTKKAMVDLWEYTEGGVHLFVPHLQVHDELDFSVFEPKHLGIIQEIMVNAVPLTVPVKCDPSVGPDWGHVEDDYVWE